MPLQISIEYITFVVQLPTGHPALNRFLFKV